MRNINQLPNIKALLNIVKATGQSALETTTVVSRGVFLKSARRGLLKPCRASLEGGRMSDAGSNVHAG